MDLIFWPMQGKVLCYAIDADPSCFQSLGILCPEMSKPLAMGFDFSLTFIGHTLIIN